MQNAASGFSFTESNPQRTAPRFASLYPADIVPYSAAPPNRLPKFLRHRHDTGIGTVLRRPLHRTVTAGDTGPVYTVWPAAVPPVFFFFLVEYKWFSPDCR